MKYLKSFLNNEDGSIAIQFSIVMIPLLAVTGVGIDYSRVAVVKTSLQSTLDHNVIMMSPKEFSNRAEMEKYIEALAGVNLDSDTVSADISIYKDVMRIDLRDIVKTPVMGLIGKSEVQVLASVDLEYDQQPTSRSLGNTKTSLKPDRDAEQINRSQLNKMKRKILAQIDRVKAYKYSSPANKNKIIKRLRAKLQQLKKL